MTLLPLLAVFAFADGDDTGYGGLGNDTLYGDDGVILAEWDLSFVVTPSAPTTTGS